MNTSFFKVNCRLKEIATCLETGGKNLVRYPNKTGMRMWEVGRIL